MANIVRVKPQLVRSRTQVVLPKNVSVVIKPSKTKIVDLKELRRQPKPKSTPPIVPQKPVSPQPAPLAAIARQKLIKSRRSVRKRTEVRYVTREATPESAAKIAPLKNIGRNKLLIIVGNGPSILEADLTKLRQDSHIEFLSINKPDSRVWPTNYWAFFDTSQFHRNEDLWNGYDGYIFNSTAIKRQKPHSMQFRNKGGKGWSRDLLSGLNIGRSSVYASMQIAAWMGHEHVYIFGVDMNPDGLNGKLHFYGKNPDVDPEARKQRFANEASFYEHAATILTDDERKKFTFCSFYNKWPFVNHYNRLDHREAVDHILAHAKRLNNVL